MATKHAPQSSPGDEHFGKDKVTTIAFYALMGAMALGLLYIIGLIFVL